MKPTKKFTLRNQVLSSVIISLLFINSTNAQLYDYKLGMNDPKLWTIDVNHLGSKLINITYNSEEDAVVMQPTWSINDTSSTETSVRNINNGRLHTYQNIKQSDCTQSEIQFEINIPQEYITEGKLEFIFSLQAGAEGDYLFNARKFKMSDFAKNGDTYKKIIVVASDFNDDPLKLRKIERVNFIFERKGSIISAPIKIRNVEIFLHKELIIPTKEEVKIVNPHSYYQFLYNSQKPINSLNVWVSTESMDITRKLNQNGNGVVFIPQWGNGEIPEGHTGNVSINQPLGAKHNFEPFEIEYVFNIPQAYIDENKMQIVLFVQAGEDGFYVWSGVARELSLFSKQAGQDVTIRLSSEDFKINKQKKKNQIESIGFKFDRNGSILKEPIILKSITVKLDDKALTK